MKLRFSPITMLCLVASSLSIHAAALDIKEQQKSCGLTYKEDQFGNVHIALPDDKVSSKEFSKNLQTFVAKHKKEQEGSAFMITIAHEPGTLEHAIKEAGFTTLHANDFGVQWVVLNGSPMPLPFTATQGARVVLIKHGDDGECLVAGIMDRYKPSFMFPGGAVDLREFPVKAAQRECREEVGVSVDLEQLVRVATVSRKRGNRYGANDVCDYYVAEVDAKQELTPDRKEVADAFWVSLDHVVKNGGYKGLRASAITMKILEHVLNKGKSERVELLDYRQMRKEHPDFEDVMMLELIAQL